MPYLCHCNGMSVEISKMRIVKNTLRRMLISCGTHYRLRTSWHSRLTISQASKKAVRRRTSSACVGKSGMLARKDVRAASCSLNTAFHWPALAARDHSSHLTRTNCRSLSKRTPAGAPMCDLALNQLQVSQKEANMLVSTCGRVWRQGRESVVGASCV